MSAASIGSSGPGATTVRSAWTSTWSSGSGIASAIRLAAIAGPSASSARAAELTPPSAITPSAAASV